MVCVCVGGGGGGHGTKQPVLRRGERGVGFGSRHDGSPCQHPLTFCCLAQDKGNLFVPTVATGILHQSPRLRRKGSVHVSFPAVMTEVINKEEAEAGEPAEVPYVLYQALYDYSSQDPDDLCFAANDILQVTDEGDGPESWFEGRSQDGREGCFPGTFVRQGFPSGHGAVRACGRTWVFVGVRVGVERGGRRRQDLVRCSRLSPWYPRRPSQPAGAEGEEDSARREEGDAGGCREQRTRQG